MARAELANMSLAQPLAQQAPHSMECRFLVAELGKDEQIFFCVFLLVIFIRKKT